MSETFDIEFCGYHSLNHIQAVVRKVKQLFPSDSYSVVPGFEDPLYLHLSKLKKEQLSAIPSFSSIRDFKIEGKLGVSPIPWMDIIKIFEDMDDRTKTEGALFVTVGYEEKSSRQSRYGYDSISVAIDSGMAQFYYRSNGSRPCVDTAYGYSVIRDLVKFLGFPIVVEGGEKEYRMHDDQGKLRTLQGGVFGENPSAFCYVIGDYDPKSLVDLLRSSLEHVGYQRLFDCSWRFIPRIFEGEHYSDGIITLFDLIRQKEFPSKLYDVDLTLGPLGNLGELDVLRRYLKKKDSLSSHLVSFDIGDMNYVNLYVTTTHEGHSLRAEMRLPDDYERVVDLVGLDIEKPRWMKKSEWLKVLESKKN